MKQAEFKWGALSPRQHMVLTWYKTEKYKDYNGIIADGAIRSGKTVSMAFSFMIWATTTFNAQNFALCGKTIESLRRNVIVTLKRQIIQRGYIWKERKSENLITVSGNGHTNSFYLFGGKDERSQDLIQGITLAGLFCDEVALMPESFVNQATARCSVEGSKYWFNCNPAGPFHWFYTGWVKKCKTRKLVYLHFTMDDNLTLSQGIKERYAAQYAGVFYKRYIQGLWVMAEGIIYDMFSSTTHVLKTLPELEGPLYISSDFGIQNATVFNVWQKERGRARWISVKEYYYSGRDNHHQKTVTELVDALDALVGEDKRNVKQVVVDPSAAALIVELRRRGYHVRQADNNVVEGIPLVAKLLLAQTIAFYKGCKNTIKEFGVYAWDEKAVKRGEDKPVKENDHAMDSVRYFCNTILKWEKKA